MSECAYCENDIEGEPVKVEAADGVTEHWCADCGKKASYCDKCGTPHPSDRLDLVCVDEGDRECPPCYEAWCSVCIGEETYGEEDEDDYDEPDDEDDGLWLDDADHEWRG